MTSRAVRALSTVAVTSLLAAGCTADATTQAGPEPSRKPQEVRIVAEDYDFAEFPTQIEAGAIHLIFENHGTVPHEVALAGIGDTPLETLVEQLDAGNTGLNGDPFPEFVDQVAVPPFVSAEAGGSAEATFTLTPGRYALFCAVPDPAEGDRKAPHYQHGMIRELTVVGPTSEPILPPADGTIIATDAAFQSQVHAGDRSVNFISEGPDEVHVTVIERYPDGVDAAEAEAAYRASLEPGPLPEGFPAPEGIGFSGIFSAGLGARLEFDEGAFESGRTYLVKCLIGDRDGGEPHFIAYDQYLIFTIE